MKNTLLPLLFVFLAAGCGSDPVSVEPPGPVVGKWQGQINESSAWVAEAYIVVDGSGGLGIARLWLGSTGLFQGFTIDIEVEGDSESFVMTMDFGSGLGQWRYTGYIREDGFMCLNYNLFGDPTWCIAPVSEPTLDVAD